MQKREREAREAHKAAEQSNDSPEPEGVPDPKRARSDSPLSQPDGTNEPVDDELPDAPATSYGPASNSRNPAPRPVPLTDEQKKREEATYKEAEAEGQMMDDMFSVLEERKKILRAARQNFDVEKYRKGDLYQESFSEEDVAYQLLTQGAYATDISIKARTEGTKKSRRLVPELQVITEDGVPTVVPTYSKKDYELTMTANYARSKRLLDPKEPDPLEPTKAKDVQTLHSELRFGFSVFAAEKERKPGGTTYPFEFGEGSCDVDDAIKANPDALLGKRRSNLYRYQSLEPPTTASGDPATLSAREGMHTIEVGSLELFKQPRKIGYPLFVSPFVEKCSLADLVYDQKGFVDLSDAQNAKKYHRAMRYRFEVMRLWWKLFHNQQDLVRALIEVESMGGDNAAISPTMRAQFSDALQDVIDASRPPMILSIIELGREGSLRYGTIYPRYIQSDDFDIKKNRNLFKLAEPLPEAVLVGRLEDENEQTQTQPVQLWENYCWPVVMPGMTRSWLDWVAGATKVVTRKVTPTGVDIEEKIINGVKDRNLQAFQIMRAFFHKDLAADYDTIFTTPTPELKTYQDELLGEAFPDLKERKRNFWLLVEVVSGDLMQAMPYWANSHLCEDLVSHPPEDVQDRSDRVRDLEEEVLSLYIQIEALKSTMDTDPKTDTEKLVKERQERELYDLTALRAEKLNTIVELTYQSSASSILWMPYASRLRKARDKNDSDALFSKTWAQESLHRCILSIYDNSWLYEYYSTNMGPMGQIQRSYDGTQITEGQKDAAELYRQWFSEVYLELGDDGIALPDQLVVMTNLVKEGMPVLTDKKMKGSVQLQGHVARIVKRTPRPAGARTPAFPPFDYVLETQFDFVGTVAELKAAKAARKVSPNNKWMVTLSGLHIMPFSYNHQYRYGDTVEVNELTAAVATGISEKAIARNNKMFRGTDPAKPLRWSIVEAPYVGPPSVLESYGIGEFNADSAKDSYAGAASKSPEWAKHTVEIGAIVISPFDSDRFEEQSESNKDEYLRWPITLIKDAGGVMRSFLAPMDQAVPPVPAMQSLNPYRISSTKEEVRIFMRPRKVSLVMRSSASSALETDEYGGPHACIEKEREERA
jgi:hypothetical protein